MAEQWPDRRIGADSWRDLRRRHGVQRLGPTGHWYLPADSSILRWSRQAARIHGHPGAPGRVSLDMLLSTLGEEDAALLSERLEDALANRRDFGLECSVQSAAVCRRVRILGGCERGPAGHSAGVLAIVQEVSGHDAALGSAEARQPDFLETASDWVWEMDADLRFTYISPQIERMGFAASEQIGRTRFEFLSGLEITPEVRAHLDALARREPFRDFRYWRAGPEGIRRRLSTSGQPVFGRDGTFLGYRGCGRDLTGDRRPREDLLEANRELSLAKKRAEQAVAKLEEANARLAERNADMACAQSEIRRSALYDDLTGLPNRRHLDDRLAGYARRRREGELLGLLQIDLDRFKQINETLGHATGDAVLRHVARALLRRATPEDFVARIGGDEFALVLASIPDERGLEQLARDLIEEIGRPFVHEGRECWFGASIGIAAARGTEIRPAELLIDADIALYRAKSQGRGSCRFFTEELRREIVRHKAVADGVLAGLKRGEFVPYYQPQICARTFAIAGVEALARWRHPVEGLVAPDAFLGAAEDLDVVGILDGSILAAAIEDLGRWRAEGVDVPKLSVNISARRLLDRDLIGGMAQMPLPRGVLAFELLETAFLDNPTETVAWNIDMLKEMGIAIELDDFGSGHASIVSLVRLAPDALKIARELVAGVVDDPTRSGLVRSIVEIGRTLGTRIIAEGVETAAQAGLLAEIGCDVLQGYHFARPMPAAEFPAFAGRWGASKRRLESRAG